MDRDCVLLGLAYGTMLELSISTTCARIKSATYPEGWKPRWDDREKDTSHFLASACHELCLQPASYELKRMNCGL